MDLLTLEALLENEIITQDEYDAIAALLPEDSGNGMPGSAPDGQPGGMSGQPDSYDAARSLSEDAAISGETIESTGTDENALLVTGGAVSVDGATVTRASDDSTGGDASSFYGVGAAILAIGGTLTVSNSTITTDANGGAGVFAYGDAVVTVSDATISASGAASGGVHVAGGGALYASHLPVATEGASSAAVRSDRGGGTLVVDGGSYTAVGIPEIGDSAALWQLFFVAFPTYFKEIAVSLLPIAAFFAVFDLVSLHLERKQLIRIGVGLAYTYLGLVIFLTGVNVGFLPAGNYLGSVIAGLS